MMRAGTMGIERAEGEQREEEEDEDDREREEKQRDNEEQRNILIRSRMTTRIIYDYSLLSSMVSSSAIVFAFVFRCALGALLQRNNFIDKKTMNKERK